MATVSNLSQIKQYVPASAATPATSDPTSTKDMTQNFLKMLTAQLQNQDPMNPTDTASMTTQLAQLNMVDSINQMKGTVGSLLSQIQSSNFMNYSSSVGKYAMVAGSSASFDGQTPVVIGTSLANDATSLTATITDSSGKVMSTKTMGPHAAGLVDFSWNGTDSQGNIVPAGSYTVTLSAQNADGSSQSPSPASFIASMVAAIGRDSSNNILLTLADGRAVTPADISQWVG